jgi:hypothetical protein
VADTEPQLEAQMRARVKQAVDRWEEAAEAERLAREQRDEVLVDAIEAGFHYREVSRWTGDRLSPSRVYGILTEH